MERASASSCADWLGRLRFRPRGIVTSAATGLARCRASDRPGPDPLPYSTRPSAPPPALSLCAD